MKKTLGYTILVERAGPFPYGPKAPHSLASEVQETKRNGPSLYTSYNVASLFPTRQAANDAIKRARVYWGKRNSYEMEGWNYWIIRLISPVEVKP